eukprot:TRINITY_DN3774_c0_g1_i1.p1 TRINITY_DN3774_c0_g1~~TRINITY_DN3774_c0_g1_i1.p1  ORF type:complete len:226 (+),score=40.32 TRINITY_DN3774_c0_g1_i1:29-706(+)
MHRIRSPWEICASVLLERAPRIAPPLTPLESSAKDVLSSIEFEKSCFSSHELRIQREATQKSTRLAIDDEDAWKSELTEFQPAKCLEDGAKALHHRPCSLLVDMDIGGGVFKWTLPFGTARSQDPSLRHTAERALTDIVGGGVDFYLWGNAPWSFYEYKFPLKVQEEKGMIGRKVFLFKGQYVGGELSPQADIANAYSWDPIESMKARLHPKEFKAIHKCTWNED